EMKRAEPLQFNRTFFHTNQIRVAGVSNSLERTQEDDFRSEREMSTCEMAREVARASLDARRAPLDGRAQVLRAPGRLGGIALADGIVDSMRAATLPGWYCGVLGRVTSWLLPKEADAAQVPVKRQQPVRLQDRLRAKAAAEAREDSIQAH